jgi:hypothetical protein
VDNFVESFSRLPHSRRKIKSLALPVEKTAALQILQNQPLSAAIDFGAGAGLRRRPDRRFCA